MKTVNTAFYDVLLLFHILPSLLLLGTCFRDSLHFTVEPESDVGTTAPARAETSQLGGPALSALQLGFLLTGQGTYYDHPIQRKNASSMFHLQVVFCCVCFSCHYYQKDRPKAYLIYQLERCQPQPQPHLPGARIFRTIKPSGRSREQREESLWDISSGRGFCGREVDQMEGHKKNTRFYSSLLILYGTSSQKIRENKWNLYHVLGANKSPYQRHLLKMMFLFPNKDGNLKCLFDVSNSLVGKEVVRMEGFPTIWSYLESGPISTE